MDEMKELEIAVMIDELKTLTESICYMAENGHTDIQRHVMNLSILAKDIIGKIEKALAEHKG